MEFIDQVVLNRSHFRLGKTLAEMLFLQVDIDKIDITSLIGDPSWSFPTNAHHQLLKKHDVLHKKKALAGAVGESVFYGVCC
ncbi:MAG TPA: hypothetical protein VIS54_07040 [Psychromonas sp.]